MAQKPLKKIKLQKNPTKYRKASKKIKTENELITKEINKAIVEKYTSMSKADKRKSRR